MIINYKNILYSTLSQEANLFINKKILAQVGLNLAAFISFLIDKGRYHDINDEITEDGYFYATNDDIFLFTGITKNLIPKLKKEGEELGLFQTKNSFKNITYYKLNFEKLLTMLSLDKSVLELAYDRVLPENEIEEFSVSSLSKFTYRELRTICKKLQIPYTGCNKKIDLINLIINSRGIEKNAKNETFSSGQESRPLEDEKVAHKWAENLPTSGQKNRPKKKQINTIQNNTKQISSSNVSYTKLDREEITEEKKIEDRYDFLDSDKFKELDDFTKGNIKKNIPELTQEKFVEIYTLTMECIKSGAGKNFNAVLYKALKGEWKFNISSETKIKDNKLDDDKKRWLSYFAGIVCDKSQKAEIEKIIIDIPLETLQKNRSKLGKVTLFEFKQILISLRDRQE